MVDFHHQNIPTPVVTTEDRILHGITTLTDALTDSPTAQLYAQLQAIKSLWDASASWASPYETPVQPSLHVPDQTRKYIRVQKRILKQTRLKQPITPQPTPREPNEPAICDPAPRVHIPSNLPVPPPTRVHPIATAPYQPIASRNRSQTCNSQRIANLYMQLNQSLMVTPYQASQQYFPQGPTFPLVHACNSLSHADPQHRNRGVTRIPPAKAPYQVQKVLGRILLQ